MTSFGEENYWTKAMRRRLSRRRMLQLSGVGLAGAALAACGSEQPATQKGPEAAPTSAEAAKMKPPEYSKIPAVKEMLAKYNWRNLPQSPNQPKFGGRLREIHYPTLHYDFVTAQHVPTQANLLRMYNLLIKLKLGVKANNFSRELEGDLAERWEMAKDGSSYTFYLRKGVMFHNKPPVNGRELTAEDVKYSFDVYKTKSIIKSWFDDVEKIEAPDKYTVKFTMKAPMANFLMQLAGPFAFIFAREVFEGPGLKENPIGTGFLMLKEEKPNVSLTLERNPNYFKKDQWGRQLPYMDGVEKIAYPDTATQKAAFRTEQIDWLYVSTPEEMSEILKTNPRTLFFINPQAPSVQGYLSPQLNKKPWDDARVRRALSMAIDRVELIDTGYGGAAIPSNYIPWDYLGQEWPPTLEQLGPYYKYDPKAAKQLLAEAGYPNGFKTDLVHDGNLVGAGMTTVLLAQKYLKDIGVDMELKPLPSMQYNEVWRGGKWDNLLFEMLSSTGFDLDNFTYDMYLTGAANNYWHYSNPEFDKLLTKQRRLVDPIERQGAAKEIFKFLTDQILRIPMVAPWSIVAMHPWLQNYTHHFIAYASFHGANQQEASWQETDYMSAARKAM